RVYRLMVVSVSTYGSVGGAPGGGTRGPVGRHGNGGGAVGAPELLVMLRTSTRGAPGVVGVGPPRAAALFTVAVAPDVPPVIVSPCANVPAAVPATKKSIPSSSRATVAVPPPGASVTVSPGRNGPCASPVYVTPPIETMSLATVSPNA